MPLPKKHFLFYGENFLEKKEAIQKISQSLPNYQRVIFSLEECLENPGNFALLKEQFLTQNFDGQKYLFHLKRANSLAVLKKNFLIEKTTKSKLEKIQNNLWGHLILFLIKALELQPIEHFILLDFYSDKLSGESFFLQILKNETTLWYFPKEKNLQNITSWIKNKLLQNKLNNDFEIVQTLVEYCNNDKIRIQQEIQKFKLLQKPLTPILISETIEMAEVSIFIFLDNVVLKNKSFLKQKLTHFFENQSTQEIQKTFALLASEFRRILKIKWLIDARAEHKIQALFQTPDWLTKKYIAKARFFSSREVENILQFLQNNDLAIKYAGQNANILLQQFCLQIAENKFRP